MNTEFFDALALLEKEKGIPMEYLLEKIKAAIAIAVKRDGEGNDDSIVEIDPTNGRFYVAFRKMVVDDVTDPVREITLVAASKFDKKAMVGSMVEIPMDTQKFGRIAAQAAKHVIRQGIREGEREQLLQEYQSRQHDIVSAVVIKIDERKGNITLQLGTSEAILPKSEQVPTEKFREGQRVRVYVSDVTSGEKGPRLMISRTHPGLVKRLFEMQVPEIFDGTVEVKAIAREAGSRTKIAVFSRDENVDAQGACIGAKGARVNDIVDELGGEKIDVVRYSEDICEFIAEALSPAQVLGVEILDENARICRVTVPDQQLSLAIGNKGQNVRLAARLTGWKIDIRPESAPLEKKVAVEASSHTEELG